jgi:hypothetical protein
LGGFHGEAAINLRSEIATVLKQAATDYNRISGGMGAWRAPESWLQCAIPWALSDRYYVMLEAQSSELLDWHYRNSRSERTLDECLEGKRIDVALFDRTQSPDNAPTIGLLEIKKYAHKTDCVDDAKKLRDLCNHIDTVRIALIVSHVEAKSEQSLTTSVDDLLREISVSMDLAAVERFRCNDLYCASVVAELL